MCMDVHVYIYIDTYMYANVCTWIKESSHTGDRVSYNHFIYLYVCMYV